MLELIWSSKTTFHKKQVPRILAGPSASGGGKKLPKLLGPTKTCKRLKLAPSPLAAQSQAVLGTVILRICILQAVAQKLLP